MPKKNENTMELVVNSQNPVLQFNFDELKERAVAMTQQYANIVVTDDSYKAAKRDVKELAGLAKEIDNKRKEVKKQMEAPIKEFEAQCKELQGIFLETKELIEKQTDIYDEKRRQEKLQKAEEFRTKAISDYGIRPEYQELIVIKPEYSNLTGTQKQVKEDIEMQAKEARSQQDMADLKLQIKEKVISSAKGTLEGVNHTIQQKLTIDDFMADIDKIFEEAEGVIDAEVISAEIGRKIINRGLEIKDAEDAIRAQAEEDARIKFEREQQASYYQAVQTEGQVMDAVPDVQPSDIPLSEGYSYEPVGDEPVIESDNDGSSSEAASFGTVQETPAFGTVPPTVNANEPKWHMTFSIEGPASQLKEIGEAIKVLCGQHGCTYTGVNKESCYKIQ